MTEERTKQHQKKLQSPPPEPRRVGAIADMLFGGGAKLAVYITLGLLVGIYFAAKGEKA